MEKTTSGNGSLEGRVIASIASVLGKDPAELSPDQRLVEDLKVDSVDKFSILMGLEKDFDREIPDQDLASFATIADILAYVGKLTEHG